MKMKNTLLTLITFFGLATLQLAYAPPASAGLFDNAKNEACGGAQLANGPVNCASTDTSGLDKTVANVVNLISIIIGIIAVIMILVNGARFITSGGDANKVNSARNGILYALIGLIVVAVAQFIVRVAIGLAS